MEKKSKQIIMGAIILALVFYFGYDLYSHKPSSGDLYVKTQLEEKGYEVIDVNCMIPITENMELDPTLKMKSFGRRSSQLRDATFYLRTGCPEGEEYYIYVVEEAQTCSYIFNGNVLRANYNFEEVEINETEIMETSDFLEWKTFVKLEAVKLLNGEEIPSAVQFGYIPAYLSLEERGINAIVLMEIIDYKINYGGYCS